jgi:hypothetical protein
MGWHGVAHTDFSIFGVGDLRLLAHNNAGDACVFCFLGVQGGAS